MFEHMLLRTFVEPLELRQARHWSGLRNELGAFEEYSDQLHGVAYGEVSNNETHRDTKLAYLEHLAHELCSQTLSISGCEWIRLEEINFD